MEVEPEMSTKALEQYLSQEDPHGRALVYEKEQGDSSEKIECVAVLDSTSTHVSRKCSFETLEKPLTWEELKQSIGKAPSLELKPLPMYLKYSFLSSGNTLPVIMSTLLYDEQVDRLLKMLRR
ncbi:hypothetical protein HAX54_043816 [Datura stramonium]|uniref:Uncharacterized protein n=1 Tax=Datura stramonium TaxID=4076 RepID=A0ABS8RQN8_DATST|nr:hypothetical protein [Datura stramonium]